MAVEEELASCVNALVRRADSSSDSAAMVAVTMADAACTTRVILCTDTSRLLARRALKLARSNDDTVACTVYVCCTVRTTAYPGDRGGNG